MLPSSSNTFPEQTSTKITEHKSGPHRGISVSRLTTWCSTSPTFPLATTLKRLSKTLTNAVLDSKLIICLRIHQKYKSYPEINDQLHVTKSKSEEFHLSLLPALSRLALAVLHLFLLICIRLQWGLCCELPIANMQDQTCLTTCTHSLNALSVCLVLFLPFTHRPSASYCIPPSLLPLILKSAGAVSATCSVIIRTCMPTAPRKGRRYSKKIW